MIPSLMLLATLALSSEPERWVIELRSGGTIEAVGPIRTEGSRTIFTSNSRAFSLANDEILSIEASSDPKTRDSAPARATTVLVSPTRRTSGSLLVDPRTAERILNAIEPAAPGSPAAVAGALPAPVTDPGPSPHAPDPRDEYLWRERWREAHDRLTWAREELDLLIRREQRLNDEILALLSNGFDESQMGRQVWQLQDTRDRIERAKLEIDRAERDVERVVRDARREGIYPSWIRE